MTKKTATLQSTTVAKIVNFLGKVGSFVFKA